MWGSYKQFLYGKCVIDVINTTNKNLRKSNPQSINDIYKQNSMIVDFSDKMKEIDT